MALPEVAVDSNLWLSFCKRQAVPENEEYLALPELAADSKTQFSCLERLAVPEMGNA